MYLSTSERTNGADTPKPIGYQGFATIIENKGTGIFFPAFFSSGFAGGEMALIGMALGMTATPTKGHTFTLDRVHQTGFGTLDEAKAAIDKLNQDEKAPLNLPGDRMFVDAPIQISWQGGANELQIESFTLPRINRHTVEAAILGVGQVESVAEAQPEPTAAAVGVSSQVTRPEKLKTNAARVAPRPLRHRFAD